MCHSRLGEQKNGFNGLQSQGSLADNVFQGIEQLHEVPAPSDVMEALCRSHQSSAKSVSRNLALFQKDLLQYEQFSTMVGEEHGIEDRELPSCVSKQGNQS